MKNIKVKCPAKVNLTLEIVNKRDDGFHNIKSIMQTINLYDYLTIKVTPDSKNQILLSGNNENIPYNEKNLVYKAAQLFVEETGIRDYKIEIYLEKNIPIAAGLAGGSTDAAGTLWGLNQIFEAFDDLKLHELCAKLGSDLNVCLKGGCVLATSRGEITQKLVCTESDITLIKPKNLGISAAEAYKKYAEKELKPQNNMTEKMLIAIMDKDNLNPYLYNDLEYAVFGSYQELQKIKKVYPKSIMSGSGSTFFVLENLQESKLNNEYEFINNLKFIPNGVGFAD